MEEKEAHAIFTLAGFIIKKIKRLPNGYCGQECCFQKYWWFVKTEIGWIEIGWRKRVINIDWSDTEVRKIVTEDSVTKYDTMVHAWSVEDAVKYLKELRKEDE